MTVKVGFSGVSESVFWRDNLRGGSENRLGTRPEDLGCIFDRGLTDSRRRLSVGFSGLARKFD
jgi:hypothetical protein